MKVWGVGGELGSEDERMSSKFRSLTLLPLLRSVGKTLPPMSVLEEERVDLRI